MNAKLRHTTKIIFGVDRKPIGDVAVRSDEKPAVEKSLAWERHLVDI